MQPIHLELHSEIDEYEEHQLANQRMDVLKNDHILGFSEMLKTSLTSWDSFNVCFAILLTLGCIWPTVPKAYAMPTNSNAQMSPVSSKVNKMCLRHTLRIYTPSILYYFVFVCMVCVFHRQRCMDGIIMTVHSTLAQKLFPLNSVPFLSLSLA